MTAQLNRLWIGLVVCLSLSSFFAIASALAEERTPVDYGTAVQPFSSDDLIRIFGRLSQENDGFISKKEIENAFKFNLPEVDQKSLAVPVLNHKTFGTTAYVNWYFDTFYSADGMNSSFSFGWGTPPNTRATPMSSGRPTLCVGFSTLSQSFIDHGWLIYSNHFNPTFFSTEYVKGKGRILLSTNADSNCMISVLMLSLGN